MEHKVRCMDTVNVYLDGKYVARNPLFRFERDRITLKLDELYGVPLRFPLGVQVNVRLSFGEYNLMGLGMVMDYTTDYRQETCTVRMSGKFCNAPDADTVPAHVLAELLRGNPCQ